MINRNAIQKIGYRFRLIAAAVLSASAICMCQCQLSLIGSRRLSGHTIALDLGHGIPVQLQHLAGAVFLVHDQQKQEVRLFGVDVALLLLLVQELIFSNEQQCLQIFLWKIPAAVVIDALTVRIIGFHNPLLISPAVIPDSNADHTDTEEQNHHDTDHRFQPVIFRPAKTSF